MKVFTILLLFLTAPSAVADEPVQLNFAVVALVKDTSIRAAFEDELVRQLHEARFAGARPSHPHVKFSGSTISQERLAASLEQLKLHGALVVRPVAVGPHSEREALEMVPHTTADTIAEFIAASDRNPNWSAAVQVGAFLFGDTETKLFWRGVSWIEEGEDRPRAIKRLAEVIATNAAQARTEFREAQFQQTQSSLAGEK